MKRIDKISLRSQENKVIVEHGLLIDRIIE